LPAAHFPTELFSLAARVAVDETHVGAGAVSPEKPHQGVASKKPASHQAEIARNSTTALGLSWSWQSGTAPGARVTYDYDAWGNTVNTTGSTPNVYLYRGEQYDAELGLYYLRARYFNPTTGRFLTTDPNAGNITAPSTLHRYTYAGADPVNRLDPSGRAAMIEGVLLDVFVLTEWAGASPKTTGMARSIYCIWDEATSWLKLGVWVDQLPPGYGVTGLARNECEVRASARPSKGKCPWHKAKRPLRLGLGLNFPQVGEVCHEYFYNPITGVSVGLGGATGTGLFGTVPGKWETGEKPGEDLGPVDDSICDCVSRKLASIPNSPPPPYFGLRWFPRDNAASNCWAWVSSIERQCRSGSTSPASPGGGGGLNAY
jgi:RHS repeat-associated protein